MALASLELPKFVSITNWKLNLFYYLLEILVALVLLYRFVNWKQNSVQAIPQGRVVAWAEGHHDRDRSDLIRAMDNLNSTLCSNPGIYEYWWDPDGEWVQGPHECLKLCAPNGARADAEACIRPSETYIQEASDQLFFVTEFGERYMDTENKSRDYFVPTTDAMKIGFEYSFSIFDNGPFESNTLSGVEKVYATEQDILTVMVDQIDGDYQYQFHLEPPNSIFLSIEQMLKLAGRSLDDIQPRAGKNFLKGTRFPDGPLTRISGVDLLVQITCFNRVTDAPIELDLKWEGPACLVEVRPAPTYWSTLDKVEVIESDGSVRRRLYHGVRVRFSIGGSYYFFDFNKVLLNLASCLVYMALPGRFMLFFCVYFLGHLSLMYSEALFERCDIVDQCAGMTARLLSMGTCFNRLKRMSTLGHGDKMGISRDQLKEQLRPIVERVDEKLSETCVERLLDFCFYTLVDASSMVGDKSILRMPSLLGKLTGPAKLRRSLQDRAESLSKHFHSTATGRISRVREDDIVTLDDFAIAHASLEPFAFTTFLELFNSDRGYSCLEYIFTPRHIRVAREKNSKALLKRESSQSVDMSLTITQRTVHDIRVFFRRCVKAISRRYTQWREKRERPSEPEPQSVEAADGTAHEPLSARRFSETSDIDHEDALTKVSEQKHFHDQLVQRTMALEKSLQETQDRLSKILKALTVRMDRMEKHMAYSSSEQAPGGLSPNATQHEVPRSSHHSHGSLPVPQPLSLSAPEDHPAPFIDPLGQEGHYELKTKKPSKPRGGHSKNLKPQSHPHCEEAESDRKAAHTVGNIEVVNVEMAHHGNTHYGDVFGSDEEAETRAPKKVLRVKGSHRKKVPSSIPADKIGAPQTCDEAEHGPSETENIQKLDVEGNPTPSASHSQHDQTNGGTSSAHHVTADTLCVNLAETRQQLRRNIQAVSPRDLAKPSIDQAGSSSHRKSRPSIAQPVLDDVDTSK